MARPITGVEVEAWMEKNKRLTRQIIAGNPELADSILAPQEDDEDSGGRRPAKLRPRELTEKEIVDLASKYPAMRSHL